MKIQIPFSRRIQELINRSNIQIRSLNALDDNLLELYKTGQKKAILVFRSRVIEVQLHVINNRQIKITDINLSVFMRPGDLVLVILPGNKGNRYVLQTFVKELFVDRFKLQTLDPRLNERVKLSIPGNVSFLQVPPLLTVELEKGHSQIIRDVQLTRKVQPVTLNEQGVAQTSLAVPGYKVTDYFAEKDQKEASCLHKKFLKHKPIAAKLIDISLGGMCIITKQGVGEKLENHFLYINIDSKGSPLAKASLHTSLKIKALAVVRTYNTASDGDYLHLMFFSQLPEEAIQFFPVQDNPKK